MKNKKFLLTLTISMLLPMLANAQESVNKSPADNREYNIFTLKNGIDVITVSDPELATSAATLSVGVGAFQDPENAQGIAHFLEHMLFMGSKKFPSPNEYMEFIQQNGGETNAFTAAEQTTYLFSINSSKFEPALDRLSASIKEPLFEPTMVGKEINAVNSEWLINRQSDAFIQQRSAAATGNPLHPRTKLGVGNKETLSSLEDELLVKLNDFYEQYYSANLMKLVLVGKQSPKELKKLANKYFSKIKNNNIDRPVTTASSYRQSDLGKNIFIKSKVKSPELVIEFSVQDNTNLWRSKPNEYVEMLLNSQEPKSLMSMLNEEGFIQSGSASIEQNGWGADGSAFISYTLTDKGLEEKEFIISSTFDYINLIKADGINKKYFDELAGINQIQFEDYKSPEALQLAVSFAFNIYDVPLKNIIDSRYVTSDYSEDAINSLLTYFDPAKARIYHISPNEMVDNQLQYADGGFRVENLNLSAFAVNDLDNKLALPEPQLIEVDDEEAVLVSSPGFESPKQIYSADGVQAFLSHTQNFIGREGALLINLKSSQPSASAENMTYAFILNAIFRKKHRTIYQRAYQRNGVQIFSDFDSEGNTVLGLLGRNSTQIKYATDLLTKFSNFEIKERDLNDAIKALRDSYDSISEQGLSAQLNYYASTTTKQGPFFFSKKEVLSSLDASTLEGLNAYYQAFKDSVYIDIFSHGLESPEKITTFAKNIRDLFGNSSQKTPWKMQESFKVVAGTGQITKVSTPKDGVGISDIYVYPEKSLKVQAQFAMINKLFSPTFFNDLRSSQQLGYAVYSLDYDIHDYPSIGMVIVSDNTNLQDLKEKMMNFQDGFAVALKDLDKKIINNVKKSMLEDLDQKPENIFIEAFKYIDDWERGNYNFDTEKQIRNFIAETSKNDLVNLNNDFVVNGKYMNITVQIRGNDFKDTPYFSWNAMN